MLTWNSYHVDDCIQQTAGVVNQLQELLGLVQETTKQANDLAAEWAAHSLFELREGQARCPFGSPVSIYHIQISKCCWSGMAILSMCHSRKYLLKVRSRWTHLQCRCVRLMSSIFSAMQALRPERIQLLQVRLSLNFLYPLQLQEAIRELGQLIGKATMGVSNREHISVSCVRAQAEATWHRN